MTDGEFDVEVSVADAELALDDRALARFCDLTRSGLDEGKALEISVQEFPAQAGLLADYLLVASAAFRQAESAADGPLERLIAEIASSKPPTANVLKHGLFNRINQLGLNQAQVLAKLHIDLSVMSKLNRGLIFAETVPQRLIRDLSESLLAPVDAVARHLDRAPRLLLSDDNSSDTNPTAGPAQSFESALSAEDRAYWRGIDGS